MYIKFGDIPGHQNLFLEYLYNFENVSRFFEKNFRDIETYSDFFERITSKTHINRQEITDAIKFQYQGFKISKQTQYNIELLSSEKTLAVITGQQLGIFGGPLYTFYKLITTIKLCKYLKENFDEYHFIPIFWLEGDDHDLDEVRSLNVINKNNENISISYDDGLPLEANRGSVGNLLFNNNLQNVFDKLNELLRETEYKNEVINFLKSHYKSGASFRDAFKNLLFDLFDNEGLIIFDPLNINVKRILIPIFKKEIEDFINHSASVVERSAELDDLFHTQVKIKPINLFFSEDNERLLLEPVENEYRLKGKRKKISKEDLLKILDTEPERFSPNVLLRPICQDYLFPTAFYVAGPSEISYFAQVMPLYKSYGIEPPFIYPRSSVTIVEKNIKDTIDKFGITFNEIFTNYDGLESKVINILSEININDKFEECSNKIYTIIDELRNSIITIDKTLDESSQKTMQKINQSINQLKLKTENAQKQRFETALRQLNKAKTNIFPNKNLQERELNFIYFANKYGLEIIKWITSEVTINKFEHQTLEL